MNELHSVMTPTVQRRPDLTPLSAGRSEAGRGQRQEKNAVGVEEANRVNPCQKMEKVAL